ncbi:proline-rich protein 2-like [Schistocerca americana]|uniref:proline-rich protein 2-like n=1 Tax=Schistocerca americana TaxID=7009 RepID=UPI001F4FEB73|nr:proline-rich protein 2-like [Schistocerca americana]
MIAAPTVTACRCQETPPGPPVVTEGPQPTGPPGPPTGGPDPAGQPTGGPEPTGPPGTLTGGPERTGLPTGGPESTDPPGPPTGGPEPTGNLLEVLNQLVNLSLLEDLGLLDHQGHLLGDLMIFCVVCSEDSALVLL